jgi:hypothetical protein
MADQPVPKTDLADFKAQQAKLAAERVYSELREREADVERLRFSFRRTWYDDAGERGHDGASFSGDKTASLAKEVIFAGKTAPPFPVLPV